MLELAAALSAGLATFAAILTVAVPAPRPEDTPPNRWLLKFGAQLWSAEASLVRSAGWPWLTPLRLAALQLAAAGAGGIFASTITGLVPLAVPAAVGGVGTVHAVVSARARSQKLMRQDAVLEAVRMLRQLLETGATNVHQAVEILGQRGPMPLRSEFRLIASATRGRRQAWSAARSRIAEPLFDMLAAAVLIQGPGGGELAPLFADLEASVSAAQEVEREARALQVQARSASSIIVALPIAFLVVLSALHSPYLDAFQKPAGEVFLLAMLAVMGCSYVWMRRLLRLPGLERVRLTDA
ncbi:MAG TPA: type II secretion system F family protein [Candidatus Micrarchaeaceae archaeon]|nr:type II secretion system F family protein [Candidatus Micrarchaeaceae archaeon]